MKNPQIKQRLINMMEQERADKLEAIAFIIEQTTKREPNTDPTELFNELYELGKHDLNAILNDILSDLESEMYAMLNEYRENN